MKFEDLEAFRHVAELGSFSRAAAHRRVAQSALSRRVARLERELGVALFERRAWGAQLTENGLVLMERAKYLADQLVDIEREVQTLASQPQGLVRMAIPPATSAIMAPRIAKDLQANFPAIRLFLREGSSGQIHSWIMSGEVDLALNYNPEENSDLDIQPLTKSQLFLVAPKDAPDQLAQAISDGLNADGRFRFKAIGSLPMIMPTPAHGARKLVDRMAAEHRVPINLTIEADGLGTILSLVADGFGCTIFSRAGLDDLGFGSRLRLIPLTPPMSWTLAMIWKAPLGADRAITATRRIVEHHVQSLISEGFWTEAS